MILGLCHISLLVADTKRAVEFYQNILGLDQNFSRPNLGYPGAWFNIGDQQLHLLELPNPYKFEFPVKHGGHDRHIAFSVQDLKYLETRLLQAGFSFTRSASGRSALFVYDPDNNALEFIETTS
jgi:glyoxylase I family protein